MKCTNRRPDRNQIEKFHTIAALMLSAVLLLTGCGSAKYDMPYELNHDVSSYQLIHTTSQETLVPFASDLCVVSKDVKAVDVEMGEVAAAALFDTRNLETLYAKNANTKVNPASLTKVMTALVALKYGSPDQMLTASENVMVTESGAVLCGLKPGDKMTLDQALHILLIYSANDVAIMIAEGIAGSVDAFVDMMNAEAISLGATNCHFMNPNGLTQDEHYVTAYDLYLIFQEALNFELFSQIIQMTTYTTVYEDSAGNSKELNVDTTNLYLKGNYDMPSGITVIGGKTGTTNAAGHCVILLSRSSDGTSYISVIMKDSSRESLYADMTALLESIN